MINTSLWRCGDERFDIVISAGDYWLRFFAVGRDWYIHMPGGNHWHCVEGDVMDTFTNIRMQLRNTNRRIIREKHQIAERLERLDRDKRLAERLLEFLDSENEKRGMK